MLHNILYHLADIKSYLEKFSSILNDIAILDRSFLDMELLKPVFCATALIGLHFTGPYLSLLLSKKTNYDVLTESFPKFYNDLLIPTVTTDMMQTQKQVITFMTEKKFSKTLPDECLLKAIDDCIIEYHDQIKELLSIMLLRLANGFSDQRGAIFGFGPKKMRILGHF